MKILPLLFILLFLLLSCQNEPREKRHPEETIISGTATSELINKPVYLKYILNDSVYTKIDTVSSTRKFQFRVSEAEYPLKAFLTNDLSDYAPKVKEVNQLSSLIYFQFGSPTVPSQFGNPKDLKFFLLDRGEMNIDIQDSIYNSKISNSRLNDELNELHKSLTAVMARYNDFNAIDLMEINNPEVLDGLFQLSSEINLEKSKHLDSFISENNNSYSSAYAFNIKPVIQKEDLKIFNQIDPEIRNSNLAAAGRKKLELKLNTMEISDTIANFMLPDHNGKQVSLYDLKSKYILIDFWASWCAPCRKENVAINTFYSDFNTEDFQVVGVSVDKDKKKWLEALKEDNTTWVSLLDGDSKVNDKFGVASYPTNFLVDADYKIIDKKLSSEQLKERLTELLE